MSGWPVLWAVIAAIFFLDQTSKYLAARSLSGTDTVPVIKGVFHLTLVFNTGAAFGMFQSQPYLFAAVALLAVFLINYLLTRKTDRLSGLERLALSFILGGALGNLADRVRLGHVIDFFDFRVWPVFNVADSFITVGAVMLGLAVLRGFGKKRMN